MSLRLVTLCTGNAARSVMLGYMFARVADVNGYDWQIRTAGTHAVEGQAMSARTLAALVAIEDLGEHPYRAHRSHQLDDDDVAWADVIVAVEAAHVNFVRQHHPLGRATTIQLRHFLSHDENGTGFLHRVALAAQHDPPSDLDVPDPAGQSQADYDQCALDLWRYALAVGELYQGSDTLR